MLPAGMFVVLVLMAVIVVRMFVIVTMMLMIHPGEVDVRTGMIGRMRPSVGGMRMRHPRQLAGEIRHDQHGRNAAAHRNSGSVTKRAVNDNARSKALWLARKKIPISLERPTSQI